MVAVPPKKITFVSSESLNEKIERGKRIKYVMKALRYSSREFEKKYGIKASTLRGWERGAQTGLTADGALKLIAAFQNEGINCTLDWLLYGKGPNPISQIIGIVPELLTFPLQVMTSTPNTITQELRLFHQLHPGAVDSIINDDGMEPCFYKGDYVAGLRYFENDMNKLLGSNCIAQLQTGQTLVRQLQSSEKNGYYTLTCINPNTSEQESVLKDIQLFSVAYIIWIRRPNPTS
ncbi:MAG TPA: helix-turn-helix transcriptional regulator [Gammaproteobacteria bacterium]|jgi:transcriptional regulator with XRE-family HTH domain|nr:helix-turn-helix transcriptional regulator [Gammaproteobacteria bacterium]